MATNETLSAQADAPRVRARLAFGSVAAAALLTLLTVVTQAQAPVPRQSPTLGQGQRPPSLLLESLAGSDSFERYCASCHGPSGRGDGPTAAVLRSAPSDLTQLAQRNHGIYPAERVRAVVVGYSSPLAAHGGTDMPVWGPIFKALDPSDLRVAARVENLVAFIERLQQPGATTGSAGAALFATHCATCHGRDARGSGVMTGELRHTPPDLTRFAKRNGGVFPRERVLRIIDGRDVAAHGDRDMPVWGDAFARTRQGLTEAEVKARLDSLVQYLEAIQERAAE